jgi:hypothetical protein
MARAMSTEITPGSSSIASFPVRGREAVLRIGMRAVTLSINV